VHNPAELLAENSLCFGKCNEPDLDNGELFQILKICFSMYHPIYLAITWDGFSDKEVLNMSR